MGGESGGRGGATGMREIEIDFAFSAVNCLLSFINDPIASLISSGNKLQKWLLIKRRNESF